MFTVYRKDFGVGPGVQRLQGSTDRPGRPDDDTVRQSQRNTAGRGHSVQFPAQDAGPHHKGELNDSSGKYKQSSGLNVVFLLCLSLTQPIGKAVVGEKMAVEISFTNPLPQVLKAVIFHVEGLGLLTAQKINYG